MYDTAFPEYAGTKSGKSCNLEVESDDRIRTSARSVQRCTKDNKYPRQE